MQNPGRVILFFNHPEGVLFHSNDTLPVHYPLHTKACCVMFSCGSLSWNIFGFKSDFSAIAISVFDAPSRDQDYL